MNKVFSLENEKSWKSVYVNTEKVRLITKSYSDSGDFMKGFEDESLGRLLKQKKEIDISSITGLQHAEKNPTELNILHDGQKTALEFSNENDLQEVTTFLASQRKLAGSTSQLSTFKAIQTPLIWLALSLIIGYVLFDEARTLEEGGTITISGRRAGVKRLFAWLADTLGTTGVLAVAGVAVAACAFFIYKNMKTPPNQVTYA